MIEDQVRRALHDLDASLPAPPDPVAWVQQRVRRRQRRGIAGAASLTALVVVLVGLVLPTSPTRPQPDVASGALNWEPRGELATNASVGEALQQLWDTTAGTVGPSGTLPRRTGPVRVLWAGRADAYELVARPETAVAVMTAETAGGGWVLTAAQDKRVLSGPPDAWSAMSWSALPAEAPAALIVDVPPGRIVYGGGSGAEAHLLAAPGQQQVSVREGGAWVRLQDDDGLFGPSLVPLGARMSDGSAEQLDRLVFRVGDRVLSEDCEHRLRPVPAAVSTEVGPQPAGWSPLGEVPDAALLADDALSLVAQRCTQTAAAAPLWSGTLSDGSAARVVSLSRPGGDPVAQLLTERGEVSTLTAGPDQAPVVLTVRSVGVDSLDVVAVGSQDVARLELVLSGRVLQSAQGRTLVHHSEYAGVTQGEIVAYDSTGDELLRRKVRAQNWQASS